MFTGTDLAIFKKYQAAGSHGFSAGLMTDEVKANYQNIFETLIESVDLKIQGSRYADSFG